MIGLRIILLYHYFKYEAIKWRVLNVSNGGALLLADQALDSQRYNQNSEDITWEKSSIRSWLNAQDTINNQEVQRWRLVVISFFAH